MRSCSADAPEPNRDASYVANPPATLVQAGLPTRSWDVGGVLGDHTSPRAVDVRNGSSLSCYTRCPAMSEGSEFRSAITRRDVIKGAVALATLGAGSPLAGRDAAAAAAPPGPPPRGGGA